MSEEVTTPETVPEVPLESTPEGGGADESRISLEKLNEVLGKDFKDVDTAIKSVKDTFSFVGKRDDISQTVKDIAKSTGKDEQSLLETLKNMSENNTTPGAAPEAKTPDTSDALAEMQKQYQEDRFFDKNEQYESIKNFIKPLKASGEYADMSWQEFADTEMVKNLMDTYNTANEAQSKKSVVESNPRLGAANDKMTNARTAQSEGNDAAARESAVSAVTDLIS